MNIYYESQSILPTLTEIPYLPMKTANIVRHPMGDHNNEATDEY